jgi:diaminobutyrate-2-oxoglutarate transaminase
VSATAALNEYWRDGTISAMARTNERRIDDWITGICQQFPVRSRGRNMFRGICFESAEVARAVRQKCYANGLIIETCGPSDEVLKFLPPLNIEENCLKEGLGIVADVIEYQMTHADHLDVVAQ